ncbi:hypothetical protein [Janthinobacterium sp. PC23-8]|nr:hypothetical protein [Janthinobacterium sp. PC23-8]
MHLNRAIARDAYWLTADKRRELLVMLEQEPREKPVSLFGLMA